MFGFFNSAAPTTMMSSAQLSTTVDDATPLSFLDTSASTFNKNSNNMPEAMIVPSSVSSCTFIPSPQEQLLQHASDEAQATREYLLQLQQQQQQAAPSSRTGGEAVTTRTIYNLSSSSNNNNNSGSDSSGIKLYDNNNHNMFTLLEPSSLDADPASDVVRHHHQQQCDNHSHCCEHFGRLARDMDRDCLDLFVSMFAGSNHLEGSDHHHHHHGERQRTSPSTASSSSFFSFQNNNRHHQ
jgi:hypothetical protein